MQAMTSRSLRRILAVLLALVMALATGFVAEGRALAEGGASVQPHDVPMPPIAVATSQVTIPPVPVSYVVEHHGWLELAYPPAAHERVASILRDADGVKAELAAALGQPVLGHVEVRIAPTFADMARLAPVEIPPPEYASGVAYNGMHLVLLTMMAPRGAEGTDLDAVFRHELAHVALEDAVKGHHVPVWFNEGLAMHLAGEKWERVYDLWRATTQGTLLPVADLDRSFPRNPMEVSIAYAQSVDFVGFLGRRTDLGRFHSLIERVGEGQPFERSVNDAYGADLRRLEYQWRSDLEKRFSVLPLVTGGSFIWVLVMGGLVYAYAKKRRRAKKILDRWEREEALEDALAARRAEAEREIALDLAGTAALRLPQKIEHDGNWHTLH
jgi:hypothetical protein